MIGLDTNLLLRAVLDDDPAQSPVARQVISSLTKENPGFVSLVVILEFAWTFRARLRQPQEAIRKAIYRLWSNPAVVISNRALVTAALLNTKIDFADALLAAENRNAGCTATLTFDRRALADPHFQAAGA